MDVATGAVGKEKFFLMSGRGFYPGRISLMDAGAVCRAGYEFLFPRCLRGGAKL